MDRDVGADWVAVPDLSHEVRRLRWFRASFQRSTQLVAQHYGAAFRIDETRLAEAFLNWTEEFTRQKPLAVLDRRDFVVFSAGLLLRELIRINPVTLLREPTTTPALPTLADTGAIAAFWPEGFLYTNYCVCVLDAVLAQEFHEKLDLSPDADDLRVWESFRENVAEDPTLAIGFLDRFVGNDPNWAMPGRAAERPAIRPSMRPDLLPAPRKG